MPHVERDFYANCGTALAGAFCHCCGQEAVELHPPLDPLVRDGLGDLLAFDSRILRTLGPLLLRPGFLSLLVIFLPTLLAALVWTVYSA